DLNVLIQDNPDFRGHVYVTIPGDKLQGEVSIPLDRLRIPGLSGRYVNGKADLSASMDDRRLTVTLDSLTVNGKPLPQELMNGLRQQNLAENLYKKPENKAALRNLESVHVADGKIVLKARPPSK